MELSYKSNTALVVVRLFVDILTGVITYAAE